MSASSPVPTDHPLMQAWTAYEASEDYANAKKWASSTPHTEGSLWAAFEQGWRAAGGLEPFAPLPTAAPAPEKAPLPCPECREVDRVWSVGDGRYRCAACDVGYTAHDSPAALAPSPETVSVSRDDGSVMVRVDPVYVEQMRGEGLVGPFSRIQLDERNGAPTLLLTTDPPPTPDTVEWWRAVAQGLGVEIAKLKALAVDPSSIPADLVRISRPSPVGQTPAGDVPPLPTACIGNDPLCPCQDGDSCHYVDTEDTKAMPIPMPPIEVEDVVISKLGNRWSVTAVDGHLMLLHNVPLEAPGARGTTRSGPMPEWAAAIERNGVVIWTRTETPS